MLSLDGSRGGDAVQRTLNASVRADMAGTPITLLQTPYTYQQKVLRIWEAYTCDPLFRALIDRVVDFVANGAEWDVSGDPGDDSWIDVIKNWAKRRGPRMEREENVWNDWSRRINSGVANTLPGLNNVTKWIVKHLLLSGMFVGHWRWGEFTSGKMKLNMPLELCCYPASSITLARANQLFTEEEAYLTVLTMDQLQEGFRVEAPQYSQTGATANQITLPIITPFMTPGAGSEAFVLKYNYSPGDLSSVRMGQRAYTGYGVYPSPKFYSLLPQFAIRQKLFAADLAVLDGIVNYIMLWKIGSKEIPPWPPQKNAKGEVTKDGMIAEVRKLLQDSGLGQAIEYFVPFYVDLDVKMPDATIVQNEQKYWASTLEILQAFGIFFSRSVGGRNERMEKINLANFEELLASLQWHVRGIYQMLAERIIAANPGKFHDMPIWTPYPVNTKSEEFKTGIRDLAKMGKVSNDTLQRVHGLNPETESRRVASDMASDKDDLFDANVPTTFSQQVVQPEFGQPAPMPAQPAVPGQPPADGKRAKSGMPKRNDQSSGTMRGRPRGSRDSKPRK